MKKTIKAWAVVGDGIDLRPRRDVFDTKSEAYKSLRENGGDKVISITITYSLPSKRGGKKSK